MNKRMTASAALLLVTSVTDPLVDSSPLFQPVQTPKKAEIAFDERNRVVKILEDEPKIQPPSNEPKREVPPPLILKQDKKIRRPLTFVNTQAISCGSWKNKLCLELEALGIPAGHLKSSIQGSTHLFSDDLKSLESYEAFEARIVSLLQPENVADGISYEQRLDNATEILARSSLGVYQLLFRYYSCFLDQSFQGEEGRRGMFTLISSKKKQDELVELIIRELGRMYEWNIPVMAADYYGGPKLAIPMSKKLAGSAEYDKLLNGRRYHGYPSVISYTSSFEGDIAQFAVNEELDPGNLLEGDKVKFIRYAIAKAESNFDMQSFEVDEANERQKKLTRVTPPASVSRR